MWLSDVQLCFKSSANTVGRLCTLSGINIFAKFKPIRYPSVAPLTKAQRKGIGGNYGLVIPEFSSVTAMAAAIDGKANGWGYDRPVGGTASPYRLSDFDGYNHNAKALNPQMLAADTASNEASGAALRVTYSMEQMSTPLPADPDDVDYIRLEDLTIADYYFGVYVKQDGGTRSVKVIGTDKITSGLAEVRVRLAGLPAGTYTIYPVIADKPQGQDDLDQALTRYTTLYGLASRKVKIVATFYQIVVSAKKSKDAAGGNTVTYTISVRNDSAADITFNNNTVMLRYYSAGKVDPLKTDELSRALANGLVAKAGKTTQIASGIFTKITAALYNSCKVWVLLNGGTYSTSVMPEESIIVDPIDPIDPGEIIQ